MTVERFNILLAEDDELTRRFMRLMLAEECDELIEAEDGTSALKIAQTGKVDLIVSDVMMPGCSGIEMCAKIKESPATQLIPVVLCTALDGDEDRLKGLEAGADDFIAKPINQSELIAKVRNFRRTVLLQKQVQAGKFEAERMVKQATLELRDTIEQLKLAQAEAALAQLDVIHRLAAATEYKDSDTGDHIRRIGEYTRITSRCLGWFSDDEVITIAEASTMHDLGKIGIPDYILMKPGLLTSEEFEHMKNHTILGWRLLSGSRTPMLQIAARIARSHHEKWDGTGYPDGLTREEIPAEARIVAVADVFDALRAQRCYKPEYPIDQCFEMVKTSSDQHFDPEIVEAFLTCRDEMEQVSIGMPRIPSDDDEIDPLVRETA